MGDHNNRIVAANIRRRVQNVPLSDPECCICKVPTQDAREVYYAPKVVSIGPLHAQIKYSPWRVIDQDDLKSRYLSTFLGLNHELKEEDYIKALGNLEGKSRRCYGEQIPYHSYKFMEMLLADGCFIIVLFLKFNADVSRSSDDPIFKDANLLNHIRAELLLFENQIPFFVLQCLFNVTGVFNSGPSLVELALNFFSPIIPGHRKLIPADCVEIKHLLDLIRRSYAPSLAELLQPLEDDSSMKLKYGAWNLHNNASVRFMKSNKAGRSLLDIRFRSDAVMEIPPVKIQNEMFYIFMNLIAYEQYFGGPDCHITDYVCFMASLLKHPWDAHLLTKIGIFYFPDPCPFDPWVCEFFKFLSTKCILRKSHYSKICMKVNRHCDSKWRILLADVWHHQLLSFPRVLPFGLAVTLLVWFITYLFSFF